MGERLHIWITGASRGIGAAIAQQLAPAHNITLSGRNEASLIQVSNLTPGGTTCVVPCDVASNSGVRDAHAEAVALYGPVDILINNAGIGIFKNMVDMSVHEFDDQIAINLRGTFLCTKAVLPSMIERQRGMIIAINSVSSIRSFTGGSGYASSKAGSLAMLRSVRQEVRDHGVKVTDILVGATETEIWSADARTEYRERMMKAHDIAVAVEQVIAGFHNPRTHVEEVVLRPQRGDL